ncbi:flagellar basal body protein FliL [Alicycliphilus denitrificans]|uniref:Flagellar protein FliL n=1 Tax=Alicycliphilus denitrificans TaxID=179636 RepID=A0A858ZX92_9BURK|nr:flagellar basal body-associated FliL family protein [Alicycliphilus denitrificans]QKD45616.1 flagellar basal body protein FliL [Alicycliphilus denitrificans]
MSDTTAAPAKSKKLIIIVAVLALLLVAGGAAAWLLLAKRHAGDEEEAPARTAQAASPKTPPTFLPMENMVVNLADPGGDRFAQVGITLELADAKTAELVKTYMPSIRSSVLLLVSQRTTDELLTREGKEKLALDVRREVSRPLGFTVPKPRKRPASRDPEDEYEDDEDAPPRPRVDNNPVRQVLFSSFIIQ